MINHNTNPTFVYYVMIAIDDCVFKKKILSQIYHSYL